MAYYLQSFFPSPFTERTMMETNIVELAATRESWQAFLNEKKEKQQQETAEICEPGTGILPKQTRIKMEMIS